MASASEVLNRHRSIIGSVPSARENFVCDFCKGPVTSYRNCFGCHSILGRTDQGALERVTVIPATAAVNPGPWYSRLWTYKRAEPQEALLVASVAILYFQSHHQEILEALGGEITALTVVPSKRGIPFDRQPFRKALELAVNFRGEVREFLRHQSGVGVGRREYKPEAFEGVSLDIHGGRIVLFEDTWVSGATAISAAGRLCELGATSVLVLPIARMIDRQFWPPDHPYLTAMKREYDVRHWPG